VFDNEYILDTLKHIKRGVDLLSRTEELLWRELVKSTVDGNLEILENHFERIVNAPRRHRRRLTKKRGGESI
jgi:hypothetical protein